MKLLEDLSLLRLLQLSSPALPIGAFAYSQGLEYAVHREWIRDEATATAWIQGVLGESIARLDLPFLSQLHAAWSAKDPELAREHSRFLLACRESRELLAEDRHLGQSLARVLVGHGVELAAPWVRSPDSSFAALHALAAVSWDIPPRSALLGYVYTWAEAQSGALSRLLPLGQLAVQRILFRIIAGAPAAIDLALSLEEDDIGAFAPTVALASMLHETQYTRLFRS